MSMAGRVTGSGRGAAVGLCMVLIACAPLDRSSETVSRGASRIAAEGPFFAGAREVTITLDSLWLREDYTRIQSPRVQAEFIYASARPGGEAVLQPDMGFDQALESWNLNRNQPRSTGTMYRLEQDGRAVFYQPYQLTARGWGCVAVQTAWDPVARDRRARPGNLVFGYVCDRTRPALSPDRALRIVRGLSFQAGPAGTAAPSALIAGTGPDALLAVAQGSTGDGSTGNSAFPLRIARPVESTASGSVGIGVAGGFGNVGYYGGPFGYYRYPFGYYPYGYYPYYPAHRRGDSGGGTGGDMGGNTGGSTGGGNTGGTTGGGGVDPGVRLSVDEAGTYVVPNTSVDEAGSYPGPTVSVDEGGSYPLPAPGGGS